MDMPDNIIAIFININHFPKQVADSNLFASYRRNKGDAQHFAQHVVVELIAVLLQLIIHIECCHYFDVHVDKLRSQIKIPFKVAGVYDIDHNVRLLLQDIFPDEKLFGRISGDRVRSGQVDNIKLVAIILYRGFFGINGHSAVVTHSFRESADTVKNGCFSGVRVTNKRNINLFFFLLSDRLFEYCAVDSAVEGLLLSWLLKIRIDINQLCLVVSQRNKVIHDFVLHRIF